MEYTGPPVPYEIPQVAPVDVHRIPIASAVSTTSSMSDNLSMSFVKQPSVKSDELNKKLSNEEVLGSALVSENGSGELDDGSGVAGLTGGNEGSPRFSVGLGSSGTLGFSDASRELSVSSEVRGDRDMDESGSSSPVSEREDNLVDEAPSHDNRTQLVTFGEPELHDIEQEESAVDEQEMMIQERRRASSLVKKGLCHRCLKGTRFTEKEHCIVCNAKYCSDCVLRAMGSMPEGRKCIPCIGCPIDESKRGNLGKFSRMLKRLLTDSEVKQRMHVELSSQVNRLPPWLVIVNGRAIPVDELVLLQSCKNPPKGLRPGKYWYDKVSGLWGKEGYKPSQIISSQLAVGDTIFREASNGNTGILINNREITKAELYLLQMAGINCDGYPHFWVSDDGSYQEEGQRQVTGKIWGKTRVKLVGALLSLPVGPVPSQSVGSSEEAVNNSGDNGQDKEKRSLRKLLMVGHDQSGTSTIFKQAKILYGSQFSDERRNVKFMIQSNMYGYLGILLEGRKRFEEEFSLEMKRKQINRLPPWLVVVNGRAISLDQLVLLQSCKNPPKGLRPGKYWYDKVSGLWGKEGHKPSQIISSQLAVGDTIFREASNGNTGILINNREITKAELYLLQMAGINCDGYPHFWVSDDGSYQEEGQRQVTGKIWGKTRVKLVGALLSLPVGPVPSQSVGSSEEAVDNSGDNGQDKEKRSLRKLLMVGHDQSGTSTISKQAKILYGSQFSEDERRNVKFMIQSNMYGYLGILLEGRKRFEEEFSLEMKRKQKDQPSTSAAGNSDQIDQKNIYSIGRRLKSFSDWLLQVMMSGNLEAIFPAATREYAPLVKELWKDKAFQATYSRRNELHLLPSAANYFMHRAAEIARDNYEPSDMDILYADGITSSNGLSCMEFSFPKPAHESFLESADQHDPELRYQLIKVPTSSLGENCKWLEMFEDVSLVLYCIDLTSYNHFYEDKNGVTTNKMLESKKLFESIVTHGNFDEKEFVLVLNKFDLLEEKIMQAPLSQCDWFHDFNPVISHHQSGAPRGYIAHSSAQLAQCAYHYIAQKFKRLFDSLTGRKLYVSPPITGLEGDSVGALLKYGREILNWVEVDKPNVSFNDWSSESAETSS